MALTRNPTAEAPVSMKKFFNVLAILALMLRNSSTKPNRKKRAEEGKKIQEKYLSSPAISPVPTTVTAMTTKSATKIQNTIGNAELILLFVRGANSMVFVLGQNIAFA